MQVCEALSDLQQQLACILRRQGQPAGAQLVVQAGVRRLLQQLEAVPAVAVVPVLLHEARVLEPGKDGRLQQQTSQGAPVRRICI